MKQTVTYIFITALLFTLVGLLVLPKSESTNLPPSSGSESSISSLVCVSFLQFSLDQNGEGVLTPEMLLAETYPSYSQFEVSIVNPPIFTDTVDCSLVGETIMVEVRNTLNDQKCWSSVLVEDKLSPILNCDTIDVDCTFDLFYDDIDSLLPGLEDNCTSREDLTVTFNQQQISQNCQSDYVLILDRSWYVEDQQGNSAVCNQIIRFLRPAISDVEFPENDTLYCPNFNIDPAETGFPTYNGEEISFICGLAAWEDDVIIPQCGNTFKVMRTWNVVDWCANSTRTQLQQIFILDTVGPVISCPQDQTISNTPSLCSAEYVLPQVSVVDSCSDSQDISSVYSVNNTLYNVGDVISLEIGTTTIEIQSTDPCGNTSSCEYNVTVNDTESPTVVCADQNVSLESNGIAEVTPYTFTSFSYTDNCEIEEVLIRRMDDNCDRPQDLIAGPNIQFCCEDIGQVIMVEVQAIDSSGLIGRCMFEVEVQDKLPPVVDCPSDMTISCDDLSDDLFDYGDAVITDNCSFLFDYSEEIDIDGCKEGIITRKWVAEDPSGNIDSCTQRINVFNPFEFDPNSIIWPADTIIAGCNIRPENIETSPDFDQTPCETVSVSFSDMTLNPDSTCLDVMRQWVIVDSCTGIEYEENQMIRILNNNDPILTVPGDLTVDANPNCQVQLTLPAATVNDCSSGVQFANSFTSQGAIVDTLFDLGSTSIIYTATDECGNSSTGETVVTVIDNTPPEVQCPADTAVSNDPGECGAFIEFPDPIANDNCEIASVFVDFNDSTNASGFYPVGETVVTVIVTDGAGLSDTCEFLVEVVDVEAPILNCPADTQLLFLDELCQVDIPDVDGLITFEDNCSEFGDITLIQNPAAGETVMMVQDTFIQVIISDEAGNADTCEIQISLRDTIPPDILCPFLDTLDVFVDEDCAYILEDFTSEAMIMSNCTDTMDIQVAQTPPAGTILQGADTVFMITLSAEDLSGNEMECSFPLRLLDDINPEITCPDDVTVSTDPGVCEANVNIAVPTPTDNCEIDGFSNDFTGGEDASGVYPIGTTIVTYTVTDASGNSTTCSFSVTVEDNEAPELDCPEPFSLVLDLNCAGEIPDLQDSIDVSDNCTLEQEIDYTQTPAAGDPVSGVGTQIVLITVTDNSGNSATCEVEVDYVDETAPELTCPDDITVEGGPDCAYVVEDFAGSVIVTDNCSNSGDITVTQDPAVGEEFIGVGVYDITITAEDESGNTSTCTFEVELIDDTPPEITCPDDVTVSTDPGVCEANVDIAVPIPTDNCEIDGFSNDFTGGEDASGVYPIGTTIVIYTVTDASGNSTTCSFSVTVEDNEAPDLDCPEPFSLVLDLNCVGEIPNLQDSIEVSDNCTPEQEIDYTQTPAAGDPVNGVGIRTVVITVTDNAGNSTTCEVEINFVDETAPELTCPDDITVEGGPDCAYVVEDFAGSVIVTDNCSNSGDITVTQDPAVGEEFMGVGVYDITITAEDESGNTSTCTFEVELIDDTPPEITCPDDVTVSTDPGVCEADLEIDLPITLDNCGVESVINDYTNVVDASGVYPEGTTTVIYTVTDESGNETTCSFSVTVEDNEAPTLDCPQDSTIALDMDCEALIPDVSGWVTYSDNCTPFDSIEFTQSPPSGDLVEGPQDITVTVVVTDSVGNTASCDILITFTDTLPIAIDCPENQTEFFDGNCEFVLPDYRDSSEVVSSCTDPDSIMITQIPSPQTIIDGAEVGDSTVKITLIAETNGGESDTCMFDVLILDTIPSVLTCAPDSTIFVDVMCQGVVPDLSTQLAVEDNCISDIGFTTEQTPPEGDVFTAGDTVLVNLTVFVENGDTLNCSSQLIFLDTIAPNLDCPEPFSLALDSNCEGEIPNLQDSIIVSDNCTSEQEIAYTQTPPAGDPVVGVGSRTVTITVTDNAGNSTTCEVEIDFVDTTAPELTCPDDITVEGGLDCAYEVEDFTGQIIVSDNCSNSGDITVTQDPAVGEEFTGVGVYDITITAADSSGNTETCTFTVEVIDLTPPEITCPDDVTVSTDPGVCEADVDIDIPITSDNCGVESVVNDYTNVVDASGIYPEGTTTVIYTVTDESGNETTCSFSVTVEDNEAPALDCPQDSTIALDMNCEALIPDVSGWVTYSDNCTPFDSIEFTQSPPSGDLVEGPQDITVTVVVTDSVGNTASCDILITFTDTLPVEIVCPENQTEFFDGICEFVLPDYRDSAEVVSSCTDPDSIMITQSPPPQTIIDGAEVGDSTVTITLVVETNGGESDTCMFDVEILDTIPSVLTCAPDTSIFVNADCQGIIPDLTPELSVEDNCISNIGFTAEQDPPAGGILLAGDIVTVTYTVFVDNGDTLSCESELTVLDSISPEISCPEDTVLFLNENCELNVPDFSGEFILDPGCEDSLNIEVTQFPPAGDYPSFSGEEVEVILVASNPFNGTSDTCQFVITTQDTIPPSLECSSTGLVLDLDEDCSALIPDVSGEVNVVQDNCTEEQNIQITQIPAIGTEVIEPQNPVEVEIIADDGNGNTASCFVTIEFEDNLPPTIICPPDTIVPCQFDIDSTEQFGDPTAFDNCSDVTITFVNQFFSSNACTVDSLKRVFTAIDESGNSSSCTQTVIFDGANPDLTENDFIFTDTVFTEDCEVTDPEDIPGSIPELDPNLEVCKVINTSFEDGPVRESDFGCLEFDRTWTLVDSCANLTNPNDGIFIFDQLVVINDTVSPELIVPFLDTIIYIDSCGTMAQIDFTPATASDCVGIDTLFNNSPFADSNAGGDISGTYEEGVYEITITAEDSCGNQTAQMINLVVSDTSDLEFTCTFKVEKPFDTTTFMVPYFISEMVDGLVNSCGNEPAGLIEFSVDPNDPTDTVIIVTCEDFGMGGTEFVETVPVYAFIDGVLVDSCTTIIAITDNVIDCMIEALGGGVVDVNEQPFEEVQVNLSGVDTGMTYTDKKGYFEFDELQRGGFYSLDCDFDGDPVAGVSTFDVLLIQRYILGFGELDNPYALIAADVDKNQRVTGKDIIHLRRVILGIDQEMPVDNWRFIPASHEFANPGRAYASNYPESINIESLQETVMSADFVGVKVGDVNGSISPGARGRTGQEFWNAEHSSENQVDFYVQETGRVYGFQFEIPATTAKNMDLLDGQIAWNDYEIAKNALGNLTVSWSDPYGRVLSVGEPIFSLKVNQTDRIESFEFSREQLDPQIYREGDVKIKSLKLHWISGPQNYALHQNRPNPFIDRTTIPFELPEAEKVELHIHDNSGRMVYEAKIEGKRGYNEFELNSSVLSSGGTFHYTLRAKNFIASKVLVVAEP